MKIKLITGLILLSALKLSAQKVPDLVDNILPGKPELLAKFTHYNPEAKDSLTNKFTKMPIDTFINKINQFKAAADQLIAEDPDAKQRELKKEDLAYFIQYSRNYYINFYGMDQSPLKPGEKFRLIIKIDSNSRKKLAREIADPEFNLNNSALYQVSGAYRAWLNNYLTIQGTKKYPTDLALLGFWGYQIGRMKATKAIVTDPFIKEDQMYKAIVIVFSAIKDPAAIENAYKDFMEIATDQVYRDAVEKLYNNFKTMQTQFIAPNFSYKDINGNLVTLISLRGQYVYIDLWATWCEPCKKQFPYLAPIEKKLEGRMHFVGISIDKPKDEKTWKAYVKSAKLTGIQVLTDKGPDADFIKKFNVNAVPRFLIIDPEGKVVSSDATAPNDPQLTSQLEALLKKQE